MRIQPLGPMTWPKAILSGKTFISNEKANNLILSSEKWKDYRNSFPIFVSKMEVHEAEGKPFGNRVEVECEYEGMPKKFIYDVGGRYKRQENIMLLMELDIGEPTVRFLDIYGKRIVNHEELVDAPEIIVKLHGEIYEYKLIDRERGRFPYDGQRDTSLLVSDTARMGLFVRGSSPNELIDRYTIFAVDGPGERFHVLSFGAGPVANAVAKK